MTNTIIDFIRVPVDEYGNWLYDVDEIKDLFDKYLKVSGHEAFLMPANISVWEDLDLRTLISIRDYLNEVITKKGNV